MLLWTLPFFSLILVAVAASNIQAESCYVADIKRLTRDAERYAPRQSTGEHLRRESAVRFLSQFTDPDGLLILSGTSSWYFVISGNRSKGGSLLTEPASWVQSWLRQNSVAKVPCRDPRQVGPIIKFLIGRNGGQLRKIILLGKLEEELPLRLFLEEPWWMTQKSNEDQLYLSSLSTSQPIVLSRELGGWRADAKLRVWLSLLAVAHQKYADERAFIWNQSCTAGYPVVMKEENSDLRLRADNIVANFDRGTGDLSDRAAKGRVGNWIRDHSKASCAGLPPKFWVLGFADGYHKQCLDHRDSEGCRNDDNAKLAQRRAKAVVAIAKNLRPEISNRIAPDKSEWWQAWEDGRCRLWKESNWDGYKDCRIVRIRMTWH